VFNFSFSMPEICQIHPAAVKPGLGILDEFRLAAEWFWHLISMVKADSETPPGKDPASH
jgi:hypothetical protein